MYLNRILKNSAFIMLSAAILVAGCKRTTKDTLTDVDDNGGYASDISKVEWASNDAISIVDAAGFFYNGKFMKSTGNFGACATVATDTFSTPHILTIRFGSTNCECGDGRNRRGNIVVAYDGRYQDTADVKTITFDNYYVNNQKLDGSIKVIRVDTTVVGNWYYKVKVDEVFTTTDNRRITWQGNLVRKWVTGYTTGDRGDNIYSISGSATLMRNNGHTFGCDIATPLQVDMSCDYIKTGVFNITSYLGIRQLNYAGGIDSKTNGACDNYAQLNIGAKVYRINL